MGWLSGGRQSGPVRVVIAGGGTGGHLYPGMAVAEAIESLAPDCKISFVGTERGLEARVIPETDWDLHVMDVPMLKGQGVAGWVSGGLQLSRSGLQAVSLVRDLKPDLVVSLGGYAAGPFTLAAAIDGVPSVLMEQNLRPGLTNKTLGRFVDVAFVSFEETCADFPAPDCQLAGNPIRESIRRLSEEWSYEAPEEEGPFNILITGGSGGAESLNRRLPQALVALPDMLGEGASRLRVRHQYGRGRRQEVEGAYEGFAGEVELLEYIDDMDQAYQWCDLIICRAGGTTIAEVLALGLPAVYVPSPNVTDDQQTKNARQIAESGAGVMLPDAQIGDRRATRLIGGLIANPISLQKLSDRASGLGRADAAEAIARRCLSLLEGHS